jgi:hypothetical protein
MRLCMFHPAGQPLERGWVGRIDGEHVTQLAAQTLQSFFTGGGAAREHAVYPLDGVQLLAPVLHPPSVRAFEGQGSFAFANPAAIRSPGADVRSRGSLVVLARLAAVVGADGELGGFTLCAEWRSPDADPPKDRDFALGLGPFVVTPDEAPDAPAGSVRVFDDVVLDGSSAASFAWRTARDFAAADTVLKPGDILAGPALGVVETIEPGTAIHVEIVGLGVLSQSVCSHVEAS